MKIDEPLSMPCQKEMENSFPASVLSVSRDEFGEKEDNPDAKDRPLQLREKNGKSLPADLRGHAFIIGATGSIDSPYSPDFPDRNTVEPSQDGTTPLYNGDGMVYRVDFDNAEARLSARLVKTSCYYADVATARCKKYQGSQKDKKLPDLRFKNLGITRVSGPLGTRNQLNTAFLPLKFSAEESERLLVTWDVGRPYEIDPKTLETVTPVGKNSEWEEVNKVGKVLSKPPTLFKTIQSSAHPVFDPYTQEMFTVNVGRSLSNVFSQFFPIAYLFKELWNCIKNRFEKSRAEELEETEEELFVIASPPRKKRERAVKLSS